MQMKNIIKLFLNTTDKFLCDRIKSTFTKTENDYKARNQSINIAKELDSFQVNPLSCVIGIDSKFETNVKLRLKLIIGLFFVLVPIVVFSLFSYLTHINYMYAFLATMPVAILVSSRMETLSKRYVQTRSLEFSR
jgi:hypothetical protein